MRAIAKILLVALLWGATGLFAAMGLQVYLNVNGLIFSCGSLSVAIGMALLQITTLSEEGRNMFYEGIKPHEDYLNLGIVCVWAVPVILLFLGTAWWVIGRLAS